VDRIIASSGLGAELADVRWSARVRLQHRLADAFRSGPIFLAGDAAHAHSPAAAQGMNPGSGDGVNLGWKLAFAAGGGDPDRLLGSYEAERRPVARQVLALTHLVFFAEASTNPLSSVLRGTVLPLAAPWIPALVGRRQLMAQVVKLLSQSWVAYPHSPLSASGAVDHRRLRPGDRLPDQDVTAGGRRTRLHELTARPGVHVLLDRDAAAVEPGLGGPWVAEHRLTSWCGTGVAAVRPDGHVGFASGRADLAELGAWLDLVVPLGVRARA
jgi:hypothetical protein